jgi:hypothetical protein
MGIHVVYFSLSLMVTAHVKISQLANMMCSHCLFAVVDKSGTSCLSSCNKVDEANRLATSCSNSLISSARNKLMTTSS